MFGPYPVNKWPTSALFFLHHPQHAVTPDDVTNTGKRQTRSPVDLPAVEGLGVEGDGGRVAALGAADGHLSPQLHPGHSEDGAGIGARQREDILLIVLQETQDTWEKGKC